MSTQDTLTTEEQIAQIETMKHIRLVAKLLNLCATDLIQRGDAHDQSKLEQPELGSFAKAKPLAGMTYGSKEFDEQKKTDLQTALAHHYAHNRHHPEHKPEGIRGMDLLDVLEMVVDWLSSSNRHTDGNIWKSISINQQRFGFSDELKAIITNTIPFLKRGLNE